MAAILTRDFTPADITGILEIQHAAAEMAQWRAGDYERLVEEPAGLILVAEWEGAGGIVGFAAARAIGKEAELQNLAVRPGSRRRGVARRLLEAIHERLAEAGVERVFLEARISNLAALNLYRSCGYTERGLRRNYYASDGEDALVLERQLTASGVAGGT
jgi:[ribosomal protein S18]-alanine N-acetyltransferase